MRYLTDTNIWIYYLKNRNSPVGMKLRNTPAVDIAVCSVVWAELLYGARKYEKRDERVARVVHALSPYTSLTFDDAAAAQYAEIRDKLEARGQIIGPNDLLIGAIAKTHNLILVTNNAEFRRINGLETEDWSI
jgi:tRNA(fMet)-specific endonuclease VapC